MAKVYMALGTACDVAHASGVGGGVNGEPAIERSVDHYAAVAAADPEPTWSLFQLWHEAYESHPEYSGAEGAFKLKAALEHVHRKAVEAGVWAYPEQRPCLYLRELRALAWHSPADFAPCRVLMQHYEIIKQEALELLKVDAREAKNTSTSTFCSYLSSALASGDWADVGLYYNAMRNNKNAPRAPKTSSLLSDDAALRRDATSCPFGSAYFSLLRPGTALKPHCGPTNARLRAHLGLVVPDGDICIRCGNEPPRTWREGEVLLFDDSFEHEVWNRTDQPRLVLIVDLWHPQLDTDAKRMRMMENDGQRELYKGVVKRQHYQATEMRGH